MTKHVSWEPYEIQRGILRIAKIPWNAKLQREENEKHYQRLRKQYVVTQLWRQLPGEANPPDLVLYLIILASEASAWFGIHVSTSECVSVYFSRNTTGQTEQLSANQYSAQVPHCGSYIINLAHSITAAPQLHPSTLCHKTSFHACH